MDTTRRTAFAAVIAATLVAAAPAQDKKANKRDLSQGNTLYAVPYAHLDTQWRWAYPQVIREYIWNTMADNLALIDKYPNYVFNFSGSRRYEMMREYYPAEYAKVAAAIKAGRWFPCGSSVDEGDANVPSGESIIRHVLYGNRFFRQNFGVASQEFMLPDCFGFPYALPTLLTHCGLSGFSTQKLTWGSSVGIPFKVGNWEGPDGSKIVAALDPGAYTGVVREDLSQNTSWLARITNTGKMSGAYVDYHYYGTGDRGGAPAESSVEWIEKSISGSGPIKVVSTRADEMFESLTPAQKAKLPSYKGELLLTEHSSGSITSQAHMKRWNRKNELLADVAERASVAANLWTQTAYPAERLYNAWDLALGSQMHDMLPGTSIPKAYEYCYNDELLALNQFAAVTKDAVSAVVDQMDTRAAGKPVVVYNPLSIAREDVAEAWFDAPANRIVTVFGPDGKSVPTQIVEKKGSQVKVIFLAKVAPNSFSTFEVRFATQTQAQPSTLSAKGRVLENPRFRVTINATGDIASVYDKVNKRETLKAPARLDFQYHNPAEYPAWNMDWDDARKAPIGHVDGPATIRVVESGPVRSTIEVTREARGSKFVQRISLSAGGAGDRVEVANVIDWRSQEVALKAAFPLVASNPKATYDLQVGAIERGVNNPKKYEVPQHQWFDQTTTDGKHGVAILNESKFGSDKPSADTVRLTLLYTPGVRGGFQDEATQDFGRHHIGYAIAPHAGDWRKGKVAWAAKRFNQPLRTFVAPSHEGRLGRQLSLLSTTSDQVEIQAIKRAEDGNGFIVRVRELTGKPATGVGIKLSNMVVKAEELDGQERLIGPATVKNGQVIASVKGFGLKTYRVQLATTRILLPQPISKPVALAYNLDVASTDSNDRDGAFDAQGRSYPAEMLPKSLSVSGVKFSLGSTATKAKNALTAKGQTIKLPAGYDRVVLLTAATTDLTPIFKVGGKAVTATVPAWDGYVGNWDTRQWGGEVPEQAFSWPNPLVGLEPGYVKKAEVAWYASHRHLPGKGNGHYEYSYIFKNSFVLPKGATSITLPNDPRVRIFAISVAKQVKDQAVPAMPLYDQLDDRENTAAPSFSVKKDAGGNGAYVTIVPPLYYTSTGLRYTLDGSAPKKTSSVYSGPIFLNRKVTLRVASFDGTGKAGPVASTNIDATDSTRPTLREAAIMPGGEIVVASFSERVDKASAEDVSLYGLGGENGVRSAKLADDEKTVVLTLVKPLEEGTTLRASAVKDLAGNTTEMTPVNVAKLAPVFTAPTLAPSKSASFTAEVPTSATAPWTMNLWVKMDKQPEDRTMIGGFGRATDGTSGTGRYIAKFPTGIHFWSANEDVRTTVPFDLGRWQMITATFDGKVVRLYKDAKEIGRRAVTLSDDAKRVNVMPLDAWDRKRMLDGEVKGFTIWSAALTSGAVESLLKQGQP